MEDGLRRDRSRVMAVGVLPDRSRDKVQAGVLLDNSRDKVRVDVLLDSSRDKVRVGVLPDSSRDKVRVDVLPDHSRDKVRVGVLPDHSRVMAAVDALLDHHPVKAAEGAMVAAMVAADKAAEGKAATVVGTTSNRAAVRLNLQPPAGNGAPLRRCQRQRAGDGRSIAGFASSLPTSPVSKTNLTDQASASTNA